MDPLGQRNAFRTAIERQDHAALLQVFTPDVVFHSPIVYQPYVGRAALAPLLAAIMQVFREFRYLEEFDSPNGKVLLFHARVGERFALRAEVVVNAAGLWADHIAALVGITIDAAGYRQHFCKGDYFGIVPGKAGRISRLVYPLAATGTERVGTRIHLTLDLEGRMRLGPDAEWLPDAWREDPQYRVDDAKRGVFWRSAHRYLPWLEPSDIFPEGAGVRPRVFGPGEPQRDFIIAHEVERDLPGFVNLIGIESPGLTASPAIARHVSALLA